MTQRFAGKNAIVTGASRGIGACIAERLAAEGAKVAIVARTKDSHPHLPGSLDETLAKMEAFSKGHIEIVSDLSDEAARTEIVPAAKEGLGGNIDILVNNAAAAMYKPLTEFSLKHRRIIAELNIHAPVDLAQAAIPDMKEAGEGWIVNLSSASSNLDEGPPFPDSILSHTIGMYGASKAALNRLTNILAMELSPSNIRATAVQPVAAVLSPGADILVGKSLRPDQIESMEAMVEAAVFLCDCDMDFTGKVYNSLELLEELDMEVMTLDGSQPFAGGFRPLPEDSK